MSRTDSATAADREFVITRAFDESAEVRDRFVQVGMSEGWSQSLERLGSVLSEG
jgi:hypothetical protein